MRVSEMLRLEMFQSSKLLSGEVGLDNEIESVMVLEAIDIEKWSRRNQLILTSFYAFDNVEFAEIERFFIKMEKIGVSGLVVKVDRLIKLIPKWLIQLCQKHQIPLIKISGDLAYEKIVLAIYQPILNHQSHVLKTYYEVRQRLSSLTRNFSSLEQIMSEFHQMIQKDCVLRIPAQDVTISKGTTPLELVVSSRKSLYSMEFTNNQYYRVKLLSYKATKEYLATEVNISNSFSDECSLIVYHSDKNLKETDMMILENVIDVIQEKLQMDYLIKRDRYTRMNNLADAILQNTPQNIDELNSLLQEADMSNYDYYQAIAFSTKSFKSVENPKMIRNHLRNLKMHTLFFEHHNYSIILYNFKDEEDAIVKNELKRIFHEQFYDYPDLTFVISQLKKKEHLKDILLECLDALRFNQEYYIDHVIEINDLGIFRYFLETNQLEKIVDMIPNDLIHLQLKSPELFETLYTFFQQGRKFKETSEVMYLHVKTIRYRLNRVREILGVDLDNPMVTLNLELATYLLHLKRRRIKIDRNTHID